MRCLLPGTQAGLEEDGCAVKVEAGAIGIVVALKFDQVLVPTVPVVDRLRVVWGEARRTNPS